MKVGNRIAGILRPVFWTQETSHSWELGCFDVGFSWIFIEIYDISCVFYFMQQLAASYGKQLRSCMDVSFRPLWKRFVSCHSQFLFGPPWVHGGSCYVEALVEVPCVAIRRKCGMQLKCAYAAIN